MKKYLLPKNGNFYKANLHCHSICSDGKWTPEEIKQNYKENGYQIVAYTDHNVFLCHNDLTDSEFLALNGFEANFDGGSDWSIDPTCHVCFIALEKDNIIQPCFNRNHRFIRGEVNYKHLIKFDPNEPDFIREYSPECISKMMQISREKGFFVTYNHPEYSNETYDSYINYNGMHAMEIFNFDSFVVGNEEYNSKIYDEMLMAGKRIFCIATDDNHNNPNEFDSFGGFTMIKAEKLEYRTITKALENGEFYASQGPLINELWIENNIVHIECSPVKRIVLSNNRRHAFTLQAPDDEFLTEATFDLEKLYKMPDYFRITITDESGKHANTNAYFLDEL